MQIVGLPESKDEGDDTKQLTKLLKEKTGLKIKVSDVVEMRRLGKKNEIKTRNVIATFREKEIREKIYKERKKLIIPGNPTKSIYLNDSLTQHRQQLLYVARKLVKGRKLYAAWSQAGNVLVRLKEDSSIIQVKDNKELMTIKRDEFEPDKHHDSRRQSGETVSDVTHLSDYSYYCDSDI